MLKTILAYAKPYWRTLLSIAVMIAIMAGLNQAEPFITKQITDALVDKNQVLTFSTIVGLLAVLLVVKVFQTALNRVSWYMTNMFVVKFESHLKQIGFDHLMLLSLAFFNDQATGKVMSKLDRGVNRIVNIVNNSGMHFLPSVTTALISFVIVLYYEWRIGVITVLAFVPYVLINHWRFQKNNVLEKKEYKLYDEQYSHFWEVLNSMQLIKAFRAEHFERNRLVKFFKKYIGIRQEMEHNTNKAFSGDVLLEALSWSMYAYIVWITWQGEISIGTLVLLVGLIHLIRQPLWQINWIFWEVKRAQIGARDFFKIMSVKPQVVDPEEPVKLDLARFKGQIELQNVSFVYKKEHGDYLESKDKELSQQLKAKTTSAQKAPKELQVFDDISFTVQPGKMTALVGPSGAGKTTIASLVMRFFDPDQGQVLLDGIDIRQLSQHDLRSVMGFVSQDAYLFADTIAENLKYAKPEATEADMWQACRIAYAEEFIKALPDGLQTEIGERGVKLSGGQKQRLSLARTILKDPQIIILDEATSALDSESEMYIQRALAKLLKGRTSIVIAHRLSTIQRADNIIVLQDKRILEQGTHAQLLKQDGLYASLFKIQSGDIEKLKEWDLVE